LFWAPTPEDQFFSAAQRGLKKAPLPEWFSEGRPPNSGAPMLPHHNIRGTLKKRGSIPQGIGPPLLKGKTS